MERTLLTMSQRELDRLEVMQRIEQRRVSQVEAARLMGMSPRQVRRLYVAYRREGPEGLVSRKRGRASNRRMGQALKRRALDLIGERYSDFGPTLAHEKLTEQHGLSFSVEALRQWMIAEALWIPRAQRLERAHQPRHRRACLGELIQIDGCDHDWFEDRGPRCTLLVYVDDATSRLMELQFVESETTFAYFASTRRYLERHGKPVAFYSDRHSIFYISKRDGVGGERVTQFGRALYELNIESLCANSSPAKGRVERAHLTLQDRLVKELRLRGISTLEAANGYLPTFMADYNRRFAKPARSDYNAHRPLQAHEDLDVIFTWQEQRKLSDNLTLQYNNVLYLVESNPETLKLKRNRVRCFEYADGRVEIRHLGALLPCTAFPKESYVDQGQVVSHKRLGAVLAYAQDKQRERDAQRSPRPNELKRKRRRVVAAHTQVATAGL